MEGVVYSLAKDQKALVCGSVAKDTSSELAELYTIVVFVQDSHSQLQKQASSVKAVQHPPRPY